MPWLRWDVDAAHGDVVGHLAEELRLPVPHAFGCYVACCLGFGAHRPDGQANQVSDTTLEQWALWTGKRGRFAAAFRRRCVDDAGRVRGWWRQDALLRHQAGKRKAVENPKHENSVKSGIGIPDVRDFTVNGAGDLVPEANPAPANDMAENAGANPAQIRRKSGANPAQDVRPTITKRSYSSSSTEKTGWLTAEGREALDGILAAHPAPDALVAELVAIHSGMRPGLAGTAAAISQALVDLRLAGVSRPTGNQLRAFIRRAGQPDSPKETRPPRYAKYQGPKRAIAARGPSEPTDLRTILAAAQKAGAGPASPAERASE